MTYVLIVNKKQIYLIYFQTRNESPVMRIGIYCDKINNLLIRLIK